MFKQLWCELGSALIALSLALLASAAPAAGQIEIDGQVLKEDGSPLAGAAVVVLEAGDLYREARRQTAGKPIVPADAVESDREGRFRLTAPGPGTWRVVARAPGCVPFAQELPELVETTSLRPVRLTAGRETKVRIVDAERRPLVGARIVAKGFSRRHSFAGQDTWMPAPQLATTGEEGTATVLAPPEGEMVFAATDGRRFRMRRVENLGSSVDLVLDVVMVPARLVDAGGRPAAGFFSMALVGSLAVSLSDEEGALLLPAPSRKAGGLVVGFIDTEGFLEQAASVERQEEALLVRLSAYRALQGRVVDVADGSGIAEAMVRTEGGAVLSGRDGSFRLRIRDGQSAHLQVSAAGYLPESPEVSLHQLESGEEVEVALRKGVRVRGRVVNAQGEPVADATIEAFTRRQVQFMPGGATFGSWTRPPGIAPAASSRGDGSFELRRLIPDVPYELVASRSGFSRSHLGLPELPAQGLGEEVVLTLQAGLRASGRVVDADGRPIPGVDIRAAPESMDRSDRPYYGGSGSDEQHTSTDRRGVFLLRDLGKGLVTLHAEAEGYASTTFRGLAVEPEEPGVEDVELGDLVLERGVPLRGRVTDSQGKPLSGVRVQAHMALPQGGSVNQETALTDEDGNFVVPDVGKSPQNVYFYLAGYRQAHLQSLVADPDRPLAVVLEAGASLSVLVVDEAGDPVPRATLTLSRTSLGGSSSNSMMGGAGEEGRFEFNGEEPGPVRVEASSDRGGFATAAVTLVTGERRELRLVLRPVPTVRGRVVDAEARALAGVQVWLAKSSSGRLAPGGGDQPLFATADVAGRFEFALKETGSYVLEARRTGFRTATRRIESTGAAIEDVELVLEILQTVAVRGRVIGGDGEAVAGATLRLVNAQRDFPVAQTTSGPQGDFELEAPEAGEYLITADHPERGGYQGEPFQVGEEGAAGLLVDLREGGAVTGRILGLDAEELARVQVSAYPTTGSRSIGMRRSGSVSFDGLYTLKGLAPGEWSVQASLDFVTATGKVHVSAPGDQVELDLPFPSHRLSGVVLLRGKPLPGAEISASCRASQNRTTSGGDGAFLLIHVTSGPCELRIVEHSRGLVSVRQVEPASGLELVVDLEPWRVTGRVVSAADSLPVAGARVDLRRSAELRWPENRAATDAEGRFELAAVDSGRFFLVASAPGFADALQTLEMADGPGSEVQIAMSPAVPVELIAVRDDGTVPPRLGVSISQESRPSGLFNLRPDEDGRVVLDMLDAGTWHVEVSDDTGRTARLELTVPSAPVRVTLVP